MNLGTKLFIAALGVAGGGYLVYRVLNPKPAIRGPRFLPGDQGVEVAEEVREFRELARRVGVVQDGVYVIRHGKEGDQVHAWVAGEGHAERVLDGLVHLGHGEQQELAARAAAGDGFDLVLEEATGKGHGTSFSRSPGQGRCPRRRQGTSRRLRPSSGPGGRDDGQLLPVRPDRRDGSGKHLVPAEHRSHPSPARAAPWME